MNWKVSFFGKCATCFHHEPHCNPWTAVHIANLSHQTGEILIKIIINKNSMELDPALLAFATAVDTGLTVRLKVWEPGEPGKSGRWLDVAVNLIRDHLAIQNYNAILTALLRQLEGKLPEWVAAAKEDGSLYLFSQFPTRDNMPCNVMKDWVGQFWSGGTEGVYLQNLKDHLCNTEHKRDEKGNVTTLFLAKACRYCSSGALTLKILTTTTLFGRGYCKFTNCVRQGDKAARAALGKLKKRAPSIVFAIYISHCDRQWIFRTPLLEFHCALTASAPFTEHARCTAFRRASIYIFCIYNTS